MLEQQLSYWRKQLADLPQVHGLPLDRPRPAVRTYRGASHVSRVDLAQVSKLDQLCQSQGATLFMGLHAAFSVLLARYSNETDIVVGTVVANREQAEVADLIGFFVNSLVLRSDLSADPTFVELLNQSKSTLLDAYQHQQLPFEKLVEQLQPPRSLSHSPLFQVMLILQNNEAATVDLPGVSLATVESQNEVAKFDITLSMRESEQGLQLNWQYNTDLFNAGTIERLAAHFERLLAQLTDLADQQVMSLDMLSADERQQQLMQYQGPVLDCPGEWCLHQLFEQQVMNEPDAVALTFVENAGETQSLTYQQLNNQANQLAHYLVEQRQVQPQDLVGICVERTPTMVVGILAILKAGAAYVPMDPDCPEARLTFMLADAGLDLVLTQSHLLEQTGFGKTQTVCIDDSGLMASQAKDNPAPVHHDTANPAYVIYTSGSTGQPKGVVVEHAQVVMHLSGQRQQLGIDADEVFVLLANSIFDASVEQLFLPLVSGAKVVLPTKQTVKAPDQLKQLLVNQQVTHLHATPAYLTALEDMPQGHVIRRVMSGGDVLSSTLRQRFGARLINRYGPTEATITCVQHLHSVAGEPLNTIGKPMANTSAYVLDSELRLVPGGAIGELYIGGERLSRGYLHQQALTDERFVANPYFDETRAVSHINPGRLYRTGDLVRRQPNGNLEFMGRIDHQVKVRGFRIELGEISHQLMQLTQVDDALVLAKPGKVDDEKRLVAYVVCKADVASQPSLADVLRQQLMQQLPDYMVPGAFVLLDQFPLTANGKVDHQALPEPEVALQRGAFVAPTNETETVLCQIWQSLLGLEAVGITDNFFALGGHSLLLGSLHKQINQRFARQLSMQNLFESQTIEQLAAVLDGDVVQECGLNMDNDELLLLKPGNPDQAPLYLIHPVGGQVSCYLELANRLVYAGPVYAVQKTTAGLSSVTAMASAYIDLIVRHSGNTPHHLLGWSLGGVIGYEMVQQLQGKDVDLVMIDSFNPQSLIANTAKSPPQLLAMMLDELAIDYRNVDVAIEHQSMDQLLALALQLGQAQGIFAADFSLDELSRRFAVLVENHQAFAAYQPTDTQARVTLLRAANGPESVDNGWQGLVSDLSVTTLEGDHYTLMRGEAVRQVAGHIGRRFLTKTNIITRGFSC